VTTARRDDGGSGNGRGSGRRWNDNKVLFRRAVFGPEVDGQDDSVDVDGTEGKGDTSVGSSKNGSKDAQAKKGSLRI
jgi:hypothetical protein